MNGYEWAVDKRLRGDKLPLRLRRRAGKWLGMLRADLRKTFQEQRGSHTRWWCQRWSTATMIESVGSYDGFKVGDLVKVGDDDHIVVGVASNCMRVIPHYTGVMTG